MRRTCRITKCAIALQSRARSVANKACFRETTGTTFIKWLNAERVARAQQLLETTDMPIDCIASEVGFGTSLSLRQQFAAQLGTTPSDYRRTFCKELRTKGAESIKGSLGF
ncbi:helix-turn-helix domain-containing protein [Stutzerimonas nitrititolerans]